MDDPAGILRAVIEGKVRPPALRSYRWDSERGTYVVIREDSAADLAAAALALAGRLTGRGVSPGSRILTVLGNRPEIAIVEWSCLLSEFIWVGASPRMSDSEVAEVAGDCDPAVVICEHGRAASLSGVIPEGATIVSVDSAEWDEIVRFSPSSSFAPPQAQARDDRPVRIRYTSGTQGRPKGAVLTFGGYRASVRTVRETLAPVGSNEVLVQVAPMTHASGAMLFPYLAAGARVLIVDRFDAAGLIELLVREKGSALFAVPTMLVRMIEAAERLGAPRSLATVVYGGAGMAPERVRRAIEVFGPVLIGIYGLTESTWPVTALLREDHMEDGRPAPLARLASVGRPTSVGQVRIVGDDGSEKPTGESGQLLVKGENTMAGYWPGRSGPPVPSLGGSDKGLDADGWMQTGDLGFRDEDGFITLVDRLHDMIISGGFNVYPREVENALNSHEAVLEAAVVGRPDEDWGQTVHAAVVLREGCSASIEDLIEHCGGLIAGFKKPRSIDFVTALPKNSSGKILRRKLLD